MKKVVQLLFVCVYLTLLGTTQLFAGPPTPPSGYKWVVVNALTDEFNDNTLNTNKWLDYNPYWIGRAPGLFKAAQVSESGGALRLKSKKVTATSEKYWIHTGFVASKNKDTFTAGMYSECRMKCASDGTVTGFWMSQPIPGSKQEIDVQEGVGWSPNGNQGITQLMRQNTHSKNGLIEGSNDGMGKGASEYVTYGVWWKDKRNVNMYLGATKVSSIYTKEDFTGGMQLNLNTETQTWLGDPNVSYVANNNRNTTYVDYIRTWKLVPADNTSVSYISLQNVGNSKFVSSENGAASGMNCNRVSAAGWEKFIITDLGGGKYSLKGTNNKYVSSENGAKKMTCHRSALGGWEKFTFEHQGNQVYAIKGSNGKYIGSDMWCNNGSKGNYEHFKITWGLKKSAIQSITPVAKDLRVFPNPATSTLNISGVAANTTQAAVYSAEGKLIELKTITSNSEVATINIDNLKRGIYILKLNNKSIRFVKN